jgi:hypothetical protein
MPPFAGRNNQQQPQQRQEDRPSVLQGQARRTTAVITAGLESARWVARWRTDVPHEGPNPRAFVADTDGQITGFANARGHVFYDRWALDVGDSLLAMLAVLP